MQNKLTSGAYFHLPFCSVHCTYCDFPITTRLSLSNRYYAALLAEIERNIPEEKVDTIYFGGGTPSLAPVELIRDVIARLPTEPDPEVTLEANPDHISNKKLTEWRAAGINRFSLGVQSLDLPVLRAMLRQHSPEQALAAIAGTRKAGFENVNVDLILGYPAQTGTGFLSDVRRVIETEPDHFSIYLLEIHEGTALHKSIDSGSATVMEEAEQIDSFERAIELLAGAGYEHYEVSNFARPGKSSRHNQKYWNDAPYYAYGAGACSYLGSRRTRNLSSVSSYIEALESGQSPVEESSLDSETTRARNALIFGLRQIRGIDIPAFERRFGVKPDDLFEGSLQEHLANGLIEVSQNHLRLTRKGMLLSNEVLSSAI